MDVLKGVFYFEHFFTLDTECRLTVTHAQKSFIISHISIIILLRAGDGEGFDTLGGCNPILKTGKRLMCIRPP